MCTISIDPTSILTVPVASSGWLLVYFGGTVANCTSNSIKVTVSCSGGSNFGPVKITGNNWTAEVRIQCPCGAPATITATCNDTPPCTATYNTTLLCSCCPTITTKKPCIEYDTSGHALVRFVTNAQLNVGCIPVTVQRDFGDGSVGMQKIVTGNTNPPDYPEVHSYNVLSYSHVYSSFVNVLPPPAGCPPSPVVKIRIDPPPICATSHLLASICALFQYFFLLNAGLAIVCLIGYFFGCAACNPSLGQVTLAFGITASIILSFILLLCRKCACNVHHKLLGLLLLVIGVLLSMFTISTACLLFPLWLLIVFATAAFFFGFLLLSFWLHGCCPVEICDYWKAIINTMGVAYVAAIVLFLTLTSTGSLICLQPAGLFLALVLTIIIGGFAAFQVQLNNC